MKFKKNYYYFRWNVSILQQTIKQKLDASKITESGIEHLRDDNQQRHILLYEELNTRN